MADETLDRWRSLEEIAKTETIIQFDVDTSHGIMSCHLTMCQSRAWYVARMSTRVVSGQVLVCSDHVCSAKCSETGTISKMGLVPDLHDMLMLHEQQASCCYCVISMSIVTAQRDCRTIVTAGSTSRHVYHTILTLDANTVVYLRRTVRWCRWWTQVQWHWRITTIQVLSLSSRVQ